MGLVGTDSISSQYRLTNWLAGMSSGAFYAYRSLELPRRRVWISDLDGRLSADGMQALASGTALGIARILDREPPPLDFSGWEIEIELVVADDPAASENGTGDAVPGLEPQAQEDKT